MNKKTIMFLSLILMTTPLLGCLGGDGGGGGNDDDGDTQSKHVSNAVIKKVDEENSRILSLKDGSADWATVPTERVEELKGFPGITVEEHDTFTVTLGLFQTNSSQHSEIMGDPAVRQALSYALDYGSVHADVYNGYLSPLPGPIPKGFPHYETQNGGVPLYTYDPVKAEEVLQAAGYTKNAEGYYFDGATLQIYYNEGNTERQQMSRLYQQNLEAIGIKSQVTGEQWSQYLDRMFGGTDWDIMFLGWAPDYVDPDNYWYNFVHSSVDVYNTGYANEQVDELLDEARYANTPAERATAYAAAYQLHMQEPNLIYVGQAKTAIVMRDWVQGFEYNPVKELYFYDLSKDSTATNPDTFVYMTYGDAKNLDPADAWDSASNDVQRQVYEGLVTYQGSNAKDLVPSLATSWEWNDEGTSVTFHLREGVTYHNGNTFDATDVEMHFKRVLKYHSPESGVSHLISDFVNETGVVKVDQYTVRFDLENPSPAFLPAIAYSVGYITDWETCEAHGGMPTPNEDGDYPDDASRGCAAWFKDHAVGTGPYVLDNWEKGSEVSFVRYDDYWRGWD